MIYKRLLLSGVLLVAASAGLALPARADTQDFTIDSFTADYYLSRAQDGVAEMRIDEKIVANFPQTDQNHGILRAIPQSYEGHSLELSVQHVQKSDGSNWRYDTSTDNGNTVLKIGDPDVYVHGQQVYHIEYTVRGVANDQAGDTMIFWNVNGDQWPQQFTYTSARLHVPQALASNVTGNMICYTGASGSTQSDCTIAAAAEGQGTVITVATTRVLQGYETLSFQVGVKSSTFAAYRMSSGLFWTIIWMSVAETLPTIIAAFVVWRIWRKTGRDARGQYAGIVVPQYLPPKETSVLGSSVVLRESFAPTAISATIIDLAVRHYIKVYETGKKKFSSQYTYDLELVKAPTGLRPEELAVLTMVFGNNAKPGRRVSLDSLSDKLYQEAQRIGRDVTTDVTAKGYFTKAPDKARIPWAVAAGILLGLSFVGIPYTLGLIGAAIVCFVGFVAAPARTAKGADLKQYLFGLRTYMKLAEADRLKVLQSPHGDLTEKIDISDKGKLVTLYEHLLPYAMLFGIEKDWARQFAGLYTAPPDWYSGTSTFNAIYFASVMSGFRAETTQSFSPPSSSSGVGAGGGGGGGGGGGW